MNHRVKIATQTLNDGAELVLIVGETRVDVWAEIKRLFDLVDHYGGKAFSDGPKRVTGGYMATVKYKVEKIAWLEWKI